MMGAVKKSSGSHNAVAMTSDGPRRGGGGKGGMRRQKERKKQAGGVIGVGKQCWGDVRDQERWRGGREQGEWRETSK